MILLILMFGQQKSVFTVPVYSRFFCMLTLTLINFIPTLNEMKQICHDACPLGGEITSEFSSNVLVSCSQSGEELGV